LEEFRFALLPFLPAELSRAGLGLRFAAYLMDVFPLWVAVNLVALLVISLASLEFEKLHDYALLEILVHLEIEEGHLPRFYKLLEIQVPDDVRIEKLEDWAKLPKGWPKKQAVTRAFGDEWLDRNSAALLQIPSALVPRTNNFLLNPLHPDAPKIQIASVSRQGLDRRLLQ
jgi:hypothetical protein